MLSIVVAFSNNYVIGKDNKLLWHIPNDLKRFKNLTIGKTIIMGRKTFESLPCILPNRKHIILTQNKDFNIENDRVSIIYNIQDIIDLKDSKEEYFIIGGGEIYKQFLPHCKRLYISRIDKNFEGDAYFPNIDFNKYSVINKQDFMEGDLKYSFINLEIK